MKAKRIIAAIISSAMVFAGCLSASAAETNFGGYTSGGTSGSTYIAARIGENSSCAYYAAAGLNTEYISASHTLTVNTHLRIYRSPMGSMTVNKLDNSYSFGAGNVLGMDIVKAGAETNYPPNHYNNNTYVYSYVDMDVSYSSAVHGSWSGSGRMNY